jgi:TldD protein
MINRPDIERALSEALKTGGDFSELFFQDNVRQSLQLVDGSIENAVTGRLYGAGIRVYKGLNSVYVYTNDVSLSGLLSCARKAADAVGTGGEMRDVRLGGEIAANIHTIKELPMYVEGRRRAKILQDVHRAASAVSPEIRQVRANLIDWDSSVLIANSQGLCVTDRRVYTRLAAFAVAASGGENQTGHVGPGAMMGFELFGTRVDPENVGRQAAEQAVLMLHADMCPAGVMPVVIDGGFGGVIFHEACGHSLEATSVAFGNSEFAGRLGEKIATDIVTAIDDGTMPNEWGSINVDDEGTPSTKLVLIENGILKNYMVDRLNGRRMGMAVTGSARRQDYTFAPTSRMRNTYIAAGEHDDAEIIATMGDGLYAKSMGGGSVNPVTGEFNFAVDEGYLVRDGRIDRPVRGATLIGRGADILQKIDRVGRNMTMAQGMCGSMSGSVPTNVGQPMIRVTSMTVGGR